MADAKDRRIAELEKSILSLQSLRTTNDVLRDRIEELDKDVNGLMTLLAKEKAENERLRAALQKIIDEDDSYDLTATVIAEKALAAVEGEVERLGYEDAVTSYLRYWLQVIKEMGEKSDHYLAIQMSNAASAALAAVKEEKQ